MRCNECGCRISNSIKYCESCGALNEKFIGTDEVSTKDASSVFYSGEIASNKSDTHTYSSSGEYRFTAPLANADVDIPADSGEYLTSTKVIGEPVEVTDATTGSTVYTQAPAKRFKVREGISIKPRSIALCLFLELITIGLFTIYWTYKLTNEFNEIFDDKIAPSGGQVLLFDLITFGLYDFVWTYHMGEKVDLIRSGVVQGTSLRFVLCRTFYCLNIINYIDMQSAINNLPKK